jgi:D-aminopeptidase
MRVALARARARHMPAMINRRELLRSAVAVGLLPLARAEGAPRRSRLRDLGLKLGLLEPGRYGAITDVPGVSVGHVTLFSGEPPLVAGKGPIRTGVTAILPRGRLTGEPCRAGTAVLNGNGEMTGVLTVARTGLVTSPVLLTGTANVGIVYQAAYDMLMEATGALRVPPPVVAECWDALGDIRGRHVRAEHVREAVRVAASGAVAEGAVGGGTGMTAYEFKGGIGTSSRVVTSKADSYTVGVIANCNMGLRDQLLLAGIPVGRELRDYPTPQKAPGSSIVMIAATDAPMECRQLERLALRLGLGLARTGATANTSSGDLMLAFSTAPNDSPVLDDDRLGRLYQAAVESAEEAVLNALTMAIDVVGADGNLCPALPLERTVEILRRHGIVR